MVPVRQLISTKLQPPVLPAKTLDRPRLNLLLDDAVRRRLTLVAADAGFGKTTQVANYLAASDRLAVWYRLDAGDRDPAAFCAYLIQVLRRHLPGKVATAARRNLSMVTDWPAAAQFLSVLCQQVRTELLIVLDDFHLLASPSLIEGMTRWIEDLPQRVRLIVLSRVRPDLPLARWLAQGTLALLGAEELRFTQAELRSLLVDLHGLPLTDATLHLVTAKTEGWPAGVVLTLHAALTRGPAAAAQALTAITGSSREIYDYLAQEAFTRQAADGQRFLLATSVLSRFDAEVADEVLGTSGSRAVIDHLERIHLFLVPLDQERRWYRYHHLFQEFLQQVAAARDPEIWRNHHLRAARAWEQRGVVEDALHHNLAAGHPADAARLLAARGLDLWAKSRFEALRAWLDAIPAAHWPAYPRLYLIWGNCEIAAGEDRAAILTLEEGRRHLAAAADHEAEAEAVRMLGHLSVWDGELARLRALVDDLVPRVDEFPPAARARVLEVLARAAKVQGEYRRAETLFHDAMAAAQTGGDPTADLTPRRYLAALLAATGRFKESAVLMEELIVRFQRLGWTHEEAHQQTDLVPVLTAAGRLSDAVRQLATAAALQPLVPCKVLHGNLLVARGILAARRGLRQAAGQLLQEALSPASPSARYLIDRLPATVELSLLLKDTEPQEARRLALTALDDAPRMGPLWQGRAQLVWGIVSRSAVRCVQAADIFSGLGLSHWKALALLHAGALAEAVERNRYRDQALTVLRALRDEEWGFVAAHGDVSLLASYQEDAVVGERVGRVLAAMPERPPVVLGLRCLGRFELRRDESSVPASAWPRTAPRRLLQFLVLQDRPVHREEVMEALWPGLSPRQAANHLRVALSRLRRVLEPELSAHRPSSFVLTAGATVALARERFDSDVDRFLSAVRRAQTSAESARLAALQEAIREYSGDLVTDDPYEDWGLRARERLARYYMDALAALAEAEERESRWDAAAAHWTAVLDREREAEHAFRGLMRSYLALGRTADALTAYARCRAALAELGATPSPETRELHERITAAVSP